MNRLEDVAALGLSPDFVDRLAASIGGDRTLLLTEFQQEALAHEALRDPNRNLLLAGPTSAGKTLVAMVAAALQWQATRKGKVIYVVPLRALVTEKADEWGRVFPDRRVLPVSSDYPRSDRLIRTGQWDVAIVVLEKLYQWLADAELCRQVIPGLQAVILDEIQLVGETGRGERLEMAVSILRQYQSQRSHERLPFRLIAMGISREIAGGFAAWLDAPVIPERAVRRPVRLLEAKVTESPKGAQVFEEGAVSPLAPEAVPSWLMPLLSDGPKAQQLVHRCVAQNLRVLVYVASRRDSIATAQQLAAKYEKTEIDPETLDEMNQLEDSPVLDDLRGLMASRVGVHHGHMTPAERALVERGFRSRDPNKCLRILVATRTLGMGVNLPADVVVLRDLHSGAGVDRYGQRGQRALTIADYRNFAGRAGRLYPGLPADALGLVVLFENEEDPDLPDRLRHGKIEPMKSVIPRSTLGPGAHVMTTLRFRESFHRTSAPAENLRPVLQSTYLAQSEPSRLPALAADCESAVKAFRRLHLVSEEGLTGVGAGVAKFGLCQAALEKLSALAGSIDRWWPHRKLALLDQLFEIPELQVHLHPPPESPPEEAENHPIRERELRAYFKTYMDPTELIPGSPLAEWVSGRRPGGPVDMARFAKAMALRQWSRGVRPRDLIDFQTQQLRSELYLRPKQNRVRRRQAAFFYLNPGPIADAAEAACGLLGALRTMVETLDTEQDPVTAARRTRDIWLWEQSLRHGVERRAVAIPVAVSYATNERFRSKTVRDLYEALEAPDDPREWKGRDAPRGIRARVWSAFQAGLDWWNNDAGDWAIGERDPGMIKIALEELVAENIATPRVVPEAPAPREPRKMPEVIIRSHRAQPGALPTVDLRAGLDTLEAEAVARLKACGANREKRLSFVNTELQKAPLKAAIRSVSGSRDPLAPIWLVHLARQTIPVAVWRGDLTAADLARAKVVATAQPPLLIVAGEIAADVVDLPTGIRAIVSASVISAMGRWSLHRPEDLTLAQGAVLQPGRIVGKTKQVLTTDAAGGQA